MCKGVKNKINRSVNNSYEYVIKIIVEFKEKLSNIYKNSFKLYSQIL